MEEVFPKIQQVKQVEEGFIRFLELKSNRKMHVQDSTCHATSSTNSSQTLQASGAGAQVEDGRGNWCGVACSKLKEMKIVGKGIRPYICIYIIIYICIFLYIYIHDCSGFKPSDCSPCQSS